MGHEDQEWIKTKRDDGSQIEFAVTTEWLRSLFTQWATDDAENVENDPETYKQGKAEHYYETFEESEWTCMEIYDSAVRENAIQDVKVAVT